MKKLILILLCLPIVGFGQLGWETTFDLMGNDEQGYSTQQTNDEGYIVYGSCQDCAGDSLVTVIKTNSLGVMEWNKNYIGWPTWGENIQQTNDGGYIFTTMAVGGLGITIIKTYSDGSIDWTKDYGSNSWGCGSIKKTSDGGYILTGGTNWANSTGIGDAFLIKLNSMGDSIWGETYGEAKSWEVGKDVEETSDGGYIICGTQNIFAEWNSTFYSDIYVIKTDNLGYVSWTKTFGREGVVNANAGGNSISQTNDDGYIICGNTEDVFGFGDTHAYFIKTDSQGNNIFPDGWEYVYPPETGQASWYDYWVYNIQPTNDDGYIMCGGTEESGTINNDDLWLMKLTENGGEDWSTTFGGLGYEKARSVQQTTDGGYIVTGDTDSFNDTDDVYLIKTDADGNVNSTNIVEAPTIQKNLINKVDVLGRETTNNKGLQLHIYDDSSVEKKYLIK